MSLKRSRDSLIKAYRAKGAPTATAVMGLMLRAYPREKPQSRASLALPLRIILENPSRNSSTKNSVVVWFMNSPDIKSRKGEIIPKRAPNLPVRSS